MLCTSCPLCALLRVVGGHGGRQKAEAVEAAGTREAAPASHPLAPLSYPLQSTARTHIQTQTTVATRILCIACAALQTAPAIHRKGQLHARPACCMRSLADGTTAQQPSPSRNSRAPSSLSCSSCAAAATSWPPALARCSRRSAAAAASRASCAAACAPVEVHPCTQQQHTVWKLKLQTTPLRRKGGQSGVEALGLKSVRAVSQSTVQCTRNSVRAVSQSTAYPKIIEGSESVRAGSQSTAHHIASKGSESEHCSMHQKIP